MENIGGEDNVKSLVHCATRLRFVINDRDKVNKEAIDNNPNILSALDSGGQFQVVIGNHVSKVYQEIMNNYNLSAGDSASSQSGDDIKAAVRSKNPLSIVFEYVSGTFSPLIPALAGSGMIKALLAVLTLLNLLSADSSTYAVLNAASNGLFYFFPIFIGVSAARQLKVSPWVGGLIAAGLLEPNFTALMELENVSFMGIPLIMSEYSGTVFPMLVSIAVYAPLERFLKKHIPDVVQMFLVPMLGIIIMVPLTALALGPFSQYLSSIIAMGIESLLSFSGILTGIIFAMIWPFLVIFGVHWGITPIMIDNLARGGDPLNAIAGGATFAQMGIAFGVFLRYRNSNKNLSSLGLAGTVSGVLAGVSEPILYGLVLRYKRLIPIMLIASAVGGGLSGFFGATMDSFAFNSVLTLPAYSPLAQYSLAVGASFLIGAILTFTIGVGETPAPAVAEAAPVVDPPVQEPQVEATVSESPATPLVTDQDQAIASANEHAIMSPMEGELIPLSEVDDPVFSSEAMGKGAAIIPTVGRVVAPFDGKIVTIFKTKHAIGLESNDGVEVLIHIGLDTVELDGQHFTAHISDGDTVHQGDLLVEFDIPAIQASGYQIATPIVVTNTANFAEILPVASKNVQAGELILEVKNE